MKYKQNSNSCNSATYLQFIEYMLSKFKGNKIFALPFKATRFLKIISRECGKITDPSEARTHDP